MIDLKKYLDEFNRLSKLSCSCVLFDDWTSDMHPDGQTYFVVNFFQLNSLTWEGALYEQKGSYTHFPSAYSNDNGFKIEDGRQDLSLPVCVKGGNLVFQRGYVDFQLCREDVHILIPELDEAPEDAQEFKEKTLRYLAEKYVYVAAKAIERNYKSGWIYHQMNQHDNSIRDIWEGSGYHPYFHRQAHLYHFKFMEKYRPGEFAKHVQRLQLNHEFRQP